MKKLSLAVLVLPWVLVLVTPELLVAQAKVRIAIWNFQNNAEQQWSFSSNLGPAVRNQIEASLAEDPALSARFSILEREKLDLVMKEQGLSAAGAVDPQTAAKMGKILGVKYILTGAIDKFSINTTRGAIGKLGVGGNLAQADATINVRGS